MNSEDVKAKFRSMVEEYLCSDEFAEVSDRFTKNEHYDIKGKSMYKGVIYWHSFTLKTPCEFEGEQITKLYLMPYRIKRADVESAVDRELNKGKSGDELLLPDAHIETGNFHKRPDLQLQILLVQTRDRDGNSTQGGVGGFEKLDSMDDADGKMICKRIFSDSGKLYACKNKRVIPNIGGADEETPYTIAQLMCIALDELYPNR